MVHVLESVIAFRLCNNIADIIHGMVDWCGWHFLSFYLYLAIQLPALCMLYGLDSCLICGQVVHTCATLSRPTQPSIPSGSVNEYQLRLGRQRQVWLIPLADEHGVCK